MHFQTLPQWPIVNIRFSNYRIECRLSWLANFSTLKIRTTHFSLAIFHIVVQVKVNKYQKIKSNWNDWWINLNTGLRKWYFPTHDENIYALFIHSLSILAFIVGDLISQMPAVLCTEKSSVCSLFSIKWKWLEGNICIRHWQG